LALLNKEVEGLERLEERPSPDVENRYIVDMSSLFSGLFGGTKKTPVLSSSSGQNAGSLAPAQSVLPAGVFGTAGQKGGRRTRKGSKKSRTRKAKSRRRK
jgi:hypothetical protein